MFALAGGLLGLIVLLATLQYKWLGQISEAERDRLSATLRASAAAFAEDFDRELNRAYLLFQLSPIGGDSVAGLVGERYDRWQATSRFPRLIKDVYIATPESGGVTLTRFNPSSRFLEPAEWPAPLLALQGQIARIEPPRANSPSTVVLHAAIPTLWPDAPALVVSAPLVFLNRLPARGGTLTIPSQPSYSILLLDADYVRGEMLPSLAQSHFHGAAGGPAYELAVVPIAGANPVYGSVAGFRPKPDAKVDATADFFHLRVQDFGPLAAEVGRFTLLSSIKSGTTKHDTVFRQTFTAPVEHTMTLPDGGPMSIVVQQQGGGRVSAGVADKVVAAGTAAATSTRLAVSTAPFWRLLVKHPSGSLEQAVGSVRRRNLMVSTGILGLLAVSVGFLVVSTRRAHDLARQQLEFVATVSHELRTPLAVIRSAADNLADGVVDDEARVRRYGQLVRREGIRLSDLVEQILEFAGLQSGQRAVARHPVTIDAVLRDASAGAQAAADAAGVRIDVSIADGLPLVAGDEAALRRAFLNLIGNAVKYGAAAGWVAVRASTNGTWLEVAVSDRGIGIAPADQPKIFEPFYRAPEVVAAQIQGAGLGLSLVKRIVEAHGGRVGVTSAPGEGSTFTVTLPPLAGDTSAAASSVGAAAPQHP
jgi:two-component system, OmpR family, sensor histidine kinase SenX3